MTRPASIVEISLGPDARSAGVARRFLSSALAGWHTPQYGEDAVLLLSELVANAALHARTQIVVRIELMPDRLRLAVTDGSPRQPVVRHYSEDSSTGRGLALVNSLALRWGIDPHADGSKTVWAEVGADRVRQVPDETMADVSAFPDLDEPGGFGRFPEEGTTTLLQAS